MTRLFSWENHSLVNKENNFNKLSYVDSKSENIWNINKTELDQKIQKLKTSIESFKTRKDYVFEWWKKITKVQKEKAEKIISEKEIVIKNLEKILKQLIQIDSELTVLNQRLNSYNSNIWKINKTQDKEYKEIQSKIWSLQRTISALNKQQEILIRDFELLSKWKLLKLDNKATKNLEKNSFTSFKNEQINISSEKIQEIYKIKNFPPYSKVAVSLFKIAAKVAWLPESWATNKNLHFILDKESDWEVWVLNYKLRSKKISKDTFRKRAISRKSIWSRSTASGLWQLILANVDKFYPSGREWIWNPVEEAVWFMRYIKDRYKTPERAASYWRRNKHY